MTSTTSLIPTTTPPGSTLIRADVLGRLQRTSEQREKILDEYEHSGLSGPNFAALCGVKYQTLASWLQRRKRQRKAHSKPQPQRRAARQVRWLEASVQPNRTCASGLLLQLPGGVRAEITTGEQAGLAAALMRALEKPC